MICLMTALSASLPGSAQAELPAQWLLALQRIALNKEPREKLNDIPWTERIACRKRTCGDMRTCEQAFQQLLICGDSRRDGDEDGVPCEKVCCVIDRDGRSSC